MISNETGDLFCSVIHLIASISGVLCYLLARSVKIKIRIDRKSCAEVWPLERVGFTGRSTLGLGVALLQADVILHGGARPGEAAGLSG